jgi:lipopolysaccharide transport system permease protein
VSSKIELIILGGPRLSINQALRELWAYRDTVLAFAERDVKVKYKQAWLGVAWAVIQPLTFMAIFTFALGRLAKVPGGEGASYAAFSLSALVAWTFLQTSISFGTNSLVTDGTLLRKVYFPREVPVLGAILASTVDFVIGLLLFAAIGPFLGAKFSASWLLAPFLGVLLALLACGVALAMAALNVYYRDFRYALPFALQLWLVASPVAYPLSVVPEKWKGLYAALNPAAGALDGFRRTLALGRLPDPALIGISVAGTFVILLLGYKIFKSLEPNFADVV